LHSKRFGIAVINPSTNFANSFAAKRFAHNGVWLPFDTLRVVNLLNHSPRALRECLRCSSKDRRLDIFNTAKLVRGLFSVLAIHPKHSTY
jgi:hypothetical protein